MNLGQMVRGAQRDCSHVNTGRDPGEAIPPQFPGFGMDYGAAPGVNTCCGQSNDMCQSNPNAWIHPMWQGLDFAVSGPHRYRSVLEPHGNGVESAFTARAVGYLDCDDVFSTFDIIGRFEPSGELMTDPIRVKQIFE